MKNDVRKLTDGAMMAAIMGVVLLIDRQTAGLLQGTVIFLFPLPMVFYGVKYGWKNSWSVFAAIVILAAILGTPATLVLVACEELVGMLYGCQMHDHVEMRKIILRTVVASVLVNVMTSLVFAAFFGYDIMAEVSEMNDLYTQMSANMNVAVPAGMNVEQLILTILITSVVLTGVLQGLVLHLFSRLMFKRMHMTVPASTPIDGYFPSKWSGYVAIAMAVCFFYAFYGQVSSDTLKMAMEGIGMCGTFYLMFYGMLAVMIFLTSRSRMGKVFPAVIAVFLVFIMEYFIALLGFLYITTDMHHRMMQGGFKNE